MCCEHDVIPRSIARVIAYEHWLTHLEISQDELVVYVLFVHGSCNRTRTCDLEDMNLSLFHLSYAAMHLSRSVKQYGSGIDRERGV